MKAEEYRVKAKRALASAKLLLEAGDAEGACNRAYYAMFDAAHAALLAANAGINPAATKTHRGLIAAFGGYLVKPGLLPIELGRSLNQVERMRLLADYTGDEIGIDDAGKAVDQAESFVAAVENCFPHSEKPAP